MLYPTFEFVESRGQWFPNIHLPKDYRQLVPEFYRQGRKDTVTRYAKTVEETVLKNELEIKLKWDEKEGLTNISVGPSGGFDLSDESGFPHFSEHNLGTRTSLASGLVTMKYVSELLKST